MKFELRKDGKYKFPGLTNLVKSHNPKIKIKTAKCIRCGAILKSARAKYCGGCSDKIREEKLFDKHIE